MVTHLMTTNFIATLGTSMHTLNISLETFIKFSFNIFFSCLLVFFLHISKNSQSFHERTFSESRKSVRNWSWSLMGMVLLRREFKQVFVKAAVS